MILHIIPAEKFVDRAISLFEEARPGENTFYVFCKKEDNTDLKYVKTKESIQVKIISSKEKWWSKGFIDFSLYEHIFFHNLYSHQNLYFSRVAPKNSIKHSMIWGFDFYGFKPFWNHKKYGPLTEKILFHFKLKAPLEEANSKTSRIEYLVKRSWRLLTDREYRTFNPTISDRRKAFERSDYIHTHVITDFENMKTTFNLKAKWSSFSYYTAEDYNIDKQLNNTETKVLIGNSATASNNHLEVFDILKQKSQDFTIVCPLNYGDMDYARKIEAKGRELFKTKFKPLTDFLPLEHYNEVQAQCSIVIMNHYRQQAAGNLIAALLLGSKIFMSKHSPLYRHFKSIGLNLFTVEHDLLKENSLRQLSAVSIEENRKIIHNFYSRNAIINAIRASLSQ